VLEAGSLKIAGRGSVSSPSFSHVSQNAISQIRGKKGPCRRPRQERGRNQDLTIQFWKKRDGQNYSQRAQGIVFLHALTKKLNPEKPVERKSGKSREIGREQTLLLRDYLGEEAMPKKGRDLGDRMAIFFKKRAWTGTGES